MTVAEFTVNSLFYPEGPFPHGMALPTLEGLSLTDTKLQFSSPDTVVVSTDVDQYV